MQKYLQDIIRKHMNNLNEMNEYSVIYDCMDSH